MTKTQSTQDLGKQIEQVVQEHIAATHKEAAAALERAFAAAGGTPTTAQRPSGRRSDTPSRRRAPAEMAALGERLYQAVCAKPGEAMAVLAADIGVTPRDLQRPVLHLKRTGKLRSVGQRHLTRYFPLVNEATASA